VLAPKAIVKNIIPKISLLLLLAAFLYQWLWPGQAPNAHESERLQIAENVLSLFIAFTAFATIFISARRAYYAGSKFWLFGSILLWPLSYVYTLAINRGD
jgi:hypothetical protein